MGTPRDGLPIAAPSGTPHPPSMAHPHLPAAQSSLLPQVRRACREYSWEGDWRSLSLPVGTGASGPVRAGGCGRKSQTISQRRAQAAQNGSGGQWGAMHTEGLIPLGWAINTHTSHTQTLSPSC